jgi:hypothetical protein
VNAGGVLCVCVDVVEFVLCLIWCWSSYVFCWLVGMGCSYTSSYVPFILVVLCSYEECGACVSDCVELHSYSVNIGQCRKYSRPKKRVNVTKCEFI